jgi:hypothetical protein
MGQIMMTVHTGPISLDTEFIVVNVPSPYTAIMGRRWLHRLKAVPSSLHQKLRFPTNFGIMEIKGDQVASKQCIMAAIKQSPPGISRKGKWQHNAPRAYSSQRTHRMPTQRNAKKHMQPEKS